MAAHILERRHARRFADPAQITPSYDDVFERSRIAPIPWHLIPVRRVAVVAAAFVLWWVAFGFMVAISAT
jgi:hypothetical protein